MNYFSNNNKILIFLLVFFAILTFTRVGETKEKTKVSFKCDWHHGVQFLGFYVAKEKGFYSAENLDVEIEELKDFSEFKSTPIKVANGEYDLGIGSYVLALAQKRGQPLVAVASIYQYGPQVFFAKKSLNLTNPVDFKGKRIVDKGDSWNKLLGEFLATANLTLKDVVLIKGGYELTPFYNDKIDIWGGYIINEAILVRNKGYDIDTFPAYEYGLHYLGNSIYTSHEYLKKNPEILRSFLTGTVKGWEYAVSNTKESLSILLKLFPDKKEKKSFHLQSFESSIPLVLPPGKKIGEINCNTYLNNPILDGIKRGSQLCNQTLVEAAWE